LNKYLNAASGGRGAVRYIYIYIVRRQRVKPIEEFACSVVLEFVAMDLVIAYACLRDNYG
jgi:LytS/YehU family sensor histidine kinase